VSRPEEVVAPGVLVLGLGEGHDEVGEGDDSLDTPDGTADAQIDCGADIDGARIDLTLDPEPVDCELLIR
jgi:hypothetical protein